MEDIKNLSDYRIHLKDRILETAMEAFARMGVRAVKMDDIANQLGISKRTLYEIYDNKEKLLFEGVKTFKDKKMKEVDKISSESGNVIEIIIKLYRIRMEEDRQMHPSFFMDLLKYPKIKQFFEDERKTDRKRFLKFMKRGTDEGYFLSTANYDLVCDIHECLSRSFVSNQIFSGYTIEQVFRNLLFVVLRGFCTQKGVEMLDSFLDDVHK